MSGSCAIRNAECDRGMTLVMLDLANSDQNLGVDQKQRVLRFAQDDNSKRLRQLFLRLQPVPGRDRP
jgi:hypothetical protein